MKTIGFVILMAVKIAMVLSGGPANQESQTVPPPSSSDLPINDCYGSKLDALKSQCDDKGVRWTFNSEDCSCTKKECTYEEIRNCGAKGPTWELSDGDCSCNDRCLSARVECAVKGEDWEFNDEDCSCNERAGCFGSVKEAARSDCEFKGEDWEFSTEDCSCKEKEGCFGAVRETARKDCNGKGPEWEFDAQDCSCTDRCFAMGPRSECEGRGSEWEFNAVDCSCIKQCSDEYRENCEGMAIFAEGWIFNAEECSCTKDGCRAEDFVQCYMKGDGWKFTFETCSCSENTEPNFELCYKQFDASSDGISKVGCVIGFEANFADAEKFCTDNRFSGLYSITNEADFNAVINFHQSEWPNRGMDIRSHINGQLDEITNEWYNWQKGVSTEMYRSAYPTRGTGRFLDIQGGDGYSTFAVNENDAAWFICEFVTVES